MPDFVNMPTEIHGYEVFRDCAYGTDDKPMYFVSLNGISQGVGFSRPVQLEKQVSDLCENPDDPDDHRWYMTAVKSLLVCAKAKWLEDGMDCKRNDTKFQEYDIGYYKWDFRAIIESTGSIQEIPLTLLYCHCDGYLITMPEVEEEVSDEH